jgi:hypothetical protein
LSVYSEKVARWLKHGIIAPRMSAESVTPALLFTLSPEETRVLGCLVEKEITLPKARVSRLQHLIGAVK